MPKFGYEGDAPNTAVIEDLITGTKTTCPGAGNGVSITVNMNAWTEGYKVKCCLYDASEDKVTNGETEERITGGTGWQTFNFVSPPTIVAADYYIVVFSDDGSWCWYKYPGAGSYVMRYEGSRAYEDGFPASITDVGTDYADGATAIYCTYEEAPTYTSQVIMVQCSSIPKEKKIYRRFGNLWVPQLKKLWLPTPPVNVPERIMI